MTCRPAGGILGKTLPEDWLNNGPSNGEGGLFRMGLPEGLAARLTWTTIGEKLALGFISRLDQIHFKLYAAVDQPGDCGGDHRFEILRAREILGHGVQDHGVEPVRLGAGHAIRAL